MNPASILYTEIDSHLQNDERPSEYLNEAYYNQCFTKFPFEMLHKLKKTEQSPVHHPEGNVWNHTMLVVDEAAKVKDKSKDSRVFMWAALLHDIGKPPTTKLRRGRITSYDHDKAGAELSGKFLAEFGEDPLFIKRVCMLVRYHMHVLYVLNNLPFADLDGLKRETDVEDVALLGLCDRLGRTNCDRLKEEKNINNFIKKCR